jgi:hypothetical protein
LAKNYLFSEKPMTESKVLSIDPTIETCTPDIEYQLKQLKSVSISWSFLTSSFFSVIVFGAPIMVPVFISMVIIFIVLCILKFNCINKESNHEETHIKKSFILISLIIGISTGIILTYVMWLPLIKIFYNTEQLFASGIICGGLSSVSFFFWICYFVLLVFIEFKIKIK